MRKNRGLPSGLEVEFEGGLGEKAAAHAGIARPIEAGRRSGVMATADRATPVNKSPKGLSLSQMVEPSTVLSAFGGECIGDFEKLRTFRDLEAPVGRSLPAKSTASAWLDRHYDEAATAQGASTGPST